LLWFKLHVNHNFSPAPHSGRQCVQKSGNPALQNCPGAPRRRRHPSIRLPRRGREWVCRLMIYVTYVLALMFTPPNGVMNLGRQPQIILRVGSPRFLVFLKIPVALFVFAGENSFVEFFDGFFRRLDRAVIGCRRLFERFTTPLSIKASRDSAISF